MSTQIKNTDEFNDALKLLGDAYILNIVSNLGQKSMRFNELQRSVADICPATLADRLKKLEQEKIIIRQEETVDKVSVVYDLTSKGRGILPIIKAISVFADKFV
jgi:DNA-binding HxlR family transcriptional regulator